MWNLTVQRAHHGQHDGRSGIRGVANRARRQLHRGQCSHARSGAVQGRRPYPDLSAFTTIRWDGWATFNGLTLKVTRRFTRGLSFDAEYTLSKSMDDASDTGTTNAEYNLPQNVYDPALEKGPSSFDHRNRFTANAVYDLPFARGSHGLAARVAGGWRASGILMLQSGAPFTVNLSSRGTTWPISASSTATTSSVPIWWAIPTPAQRHRRSGSTPQPLRSPLKTPSERRAETMSSDQDSKTLTCHSRRSGSRVRTDAAIPLRCFQCAQSPELQSSRPNLRGLQLRRDYQRARPAGTSVCVEVGILTGCRTSVSFEVDPALLTGVVFSRDEGELAGVAKPCGFRTVVITDWRIEISNT